METQGFQRLFIIICINCLQCLKVVVDSVRMDHLVLSDRKMLVLL